MSDREEVSLGLSRDGRDGENTTGTCRENYIAV